MRRGYLLAAAVVAGMATSASAAIANINFENIATSYPFGNDGILVQDFYNGGTSSIGTSGPDYGASFSSNATVICLNSTSVDCSNTSHGGFGDPDSAMSAMYFAGSQAFMNVAAGFDSTLSFDYSAHNGPGSVSVYDGPDGTGNLLATRDLAATPAGCNSNYLATFCPFVPVDLSFDGTARSVAFGGPPDQFVVDDISFNAQTPDNPTPPVSGVPEPASWALLIAGFGLVGAAIRRRRATA